MLEREGRGENFVKRNRLNVKRNRLNIVARSVAAVSIAAAGAAAVEKTGSFDPLTNSVDSANHLVLDNLHKSYEQLIDKLPGVENAEAQTPAPAFIKANVNIAGPIQARAKDADGWPIKLYKDVDCLWYNEVGAKPARETIISQGSATFPVKPFETVSLYVDRNPSQENFVPPEARCLNFTAGNSGSLTEITFADIQKVLDYTVSTYRVLQASAGWLNMSIGVYPPHWLIAGTALVDAQKLLEIHPGLINVENATALISYPEGCAGTAVVNANNLNNVLSNTNPRLEQTINVSATCTIDPTGKPVILSTILGGRDSAGPFNGLAVAQTGSVGGIAELPELSELPQNINSEKSKDYTIPIAVGIAGTIAAAIAATGGVLYSRRNRSAK